MLPRGRLRAPQLCPGCCIPAAHQVPPAPSPALGPPPHASVSPLYSEAMIPAPALPPLEAASSAWARILGAPSHRWQSWAPSEADFPRQCPRLVLTQSRCCLLLRFALYIICSLAPFQTYLAIVTAEDIYTAGVWNNTENLWSRGPDSRTIPTPGAGDGPPRFCCARGRGWMGYPGPGWMGDPGTGLDGVLPRIPPPAAPGHPRCSCRGTGWVPGGGRGWGHRAPLVRLDPSPQHLPGGGAGSTHC